jgi:hypothetical protein
MTTPPEDDFEDKWQVIVRGDLGEFDDGSDDYETWAGEPD